MRAILPPRIDNARASIFLITHVSFEWKRVIRKSHEKITTLSFVSSSSATYKEVRDSTTFVSMNELSRYDLFLSLVIFSF